MTKEKMNEIKKHIFIYELERLGSFGIYIGESKEEAFESINQDLWSDIYPNYEENKEQIINFEKVIIWTWEEYQKECSKENDITFIDRLLELYH